MLWKASCGWSLRTKPPGLRCQAEEPAGVLVKQTPKPGPGPAACTSTGMGSRGSYFGKWHSGAWCLVSADSDGKCSWL